MMKVLKTAVLAAALGAVSGCDPNVQDVSERDRLEATTALVFLMYDVDETSTFGFASAAELLKSYPRLISIVDGTARYPIVAGRVLCPRGLICPRLDPAQRKFSFNGQSYDLPASVNLESKFLTVNDMRQMVNTVKNAGGYVPRLSDADLGNNNSGSDSGSDGGGGGGEE